MTDRFQHLATRLGVGPERQSLDVCILSKGPLANSWKQSVEVRLSQTEAGDSIFVASDPDDARELLADLHNPVLIVDMSHVSQWDYEQVDACFGAAGAVSYAVATCNEHDEHLFREFISVFAIDDYRPGLPNKIDAELVIAQARSSLFLRNRVSKGNTEVRTQEQMRKLAHVGVAFSRERDLSKLLNLVLRECRDLLHADAGSIYILEGVKRRHSGRKILGRAQRVGRANAIRVTQDVSDMKDLRIRFAAAQNDSVMIPFKELEFPASTDTIAGYAALRGETVNIDDVYLLANDAPYHFNKYIDEHYNYRCTSMLTIPMRNMRNEVVGVIQLINKKLNPLQILTDVKAIPDQVSGFSRTDAELATTLANMAGATIENVRLYDEIQTLFESFVNASVRAIEQRDPSTAGHSARVDRITLGIADMMNQKHDGPFANVFFSDEEMVELHYAGLLHDVGKIGVREHILTKAKKLFPFQADVVQVRGDLIGASIRARAEREMRHTMQDAGPSAVVALERKRDEALQQLQEDIRFIFEINEPRFMNDQHVARLEEVRNRAYPVEDGMPARLISDVEYRSLSTRKGSLSDEERREIESHVLKSRIFLEQIPWTFELRNVPLIAGSHHEKMNGKGYPDAVPARATPLQSRIMAVADVFDSLTAGDRPYKPAIPLNRALDILGKMAEGGELDPDIVAFFIEEKVWEKLRLKVLHDHEATAEQRAAT